jgi:hypothetical protein
MFHFANENLAHNSENHNRTYLQYHNVSTFSILHHKKNLRSGEFSSIYYQRTTEFYKNKLSMINYKNVNVKNRTIRNDILPFLHVI